MMCDDVLKEMAELDKQGRQGTATIQDARPLTEDELYEMESEAREREWEFENDGILSPMRAEIVLRKIKSASSNGVQGILDGYFPSCNRGMAVEIVGALEVYNEDWEDTTYHIKPKRMALIHKWAESKAAKVVKKLGDFVPKGLRGSLYENEMFETIITAGINLGYLNKDLTVKSKNATQFYPFASKLYETRGRGTFVELGELLFGNRNSFQNIHKTDNKGYFERLQEITDEINRIKNVKKNEN